MFNLRKAQEDIFGVLQSSAQLRTINGVLQRKMMLKNETDLAIIFTTQRNGCAGAGYLVEMPTADCDSPNVDGPILDWTFSVWCLEVPTLNYAPPTPKRPVQGTGVSCEDLAQMVLEEIHNYADDSYGTFRAKKNAVTDANLGQMAVGYRVALSLVKGKSLPKGRTGQIQRNVSIPGQCSLTCANDPTAAIFYTLNGEQPLGPESGEPSLLYAGAILAPTGTTIRARAFAPGKLGSATCLTAIT